MDAGKIDLGTSVVESRTVGCTVCRANPCDCILRPCNHSFCKSCVKKWMTNGKMITCKVCNKIAEGLVGFSAPMGLPGKERLDISRSSVSVVQANCPTAELEGVLQKNSELYKEMQRNRMRQSMKNARLDRIR